jgi:hypothetical protein
VNPIALVRAAYGSALLLAPDRMLQLYGGPVEDGAAQAVARVLGGRHLVQAIVTKGGSFSRVGALVDLLHATSMFAFGGVSREHRRPAFIDGTVASMLGTAQALQARRASVRREG